MQRPYGSRRIGDVQESEVRRKEEERIPEGESFLFALLSGQEIIPQITNA